MIDRDACTHALRPELGHGSPRCQKEATHDSVVGRRCTPHAEQLRERFHDPSTLCGIPGDGAPTRTDEQVARLVWRLSDPDRCARCGFVRPLCLCPRDPAQPVSDPDCSVCEFFAGLQEGDPSARAAFYTGVAVGRMLELVEEPNVCANCAALINGTCLKLEDIVRAELRKATS